jgi:hypothetical protein
MSVAGLPLRVRDDFPNGDRRSVLATTIWGKSSLTLFPAAEETDQ